MLCKPSENRLLKIAKISPVKCYMFNFKIIYFAQFLADFNNFGFKIEVRICLIQNKRNFEKKGELVQSPLVSHELLAKLRSKQWNLSVMINEKRVD